MLGKRDFQARTRTPTDAPAGRLPRASHLSEEWLRLGIVEPTPAAEAELALPFEASIRLQRTAPDIGLQITLATSSDTTESLVLDSADAAGSGIVIDHEARRRLVLRDEGLADSCDDAPRIELAMRVEEDQILLDCGQGLRVLPYALQGRPTFRISGASEQNVPAIDRIVLWRYDDVGRLAQRLGANFRALPRARGRSLTTMPQGAAAVWPSIAIAAGVALALDLLLLLLVAWRRPALARSWGLLQLLWFPTQIALGVAAVQLTGHAATGPHIVGAALLLTKIALAHGFTRDPPKTLEHVRSWSRRVAMATLFGYAAFAFGHEIAWYTGFPLPWAVVAVLSALGVVASYRLLGRSTDAVLVAVAAAQLLLFPLVWYAAPLTHPLTWAAVVLVPWTTASLLALRRLPAPVGRWRRLAAAAIAVASACAFAEVGIRADFATDLGLRRGSELSETESMVLRQLRPAWGRAHGESDPRWDNLAFAQRLHPFDRPPGGLRIVCLGSSTTWGVGIADPARDGYPAQLERRLAARTPQSVEVINVGIPGASLDALHVLTRDLLLPMEPDLVILYFGVNGEVPGTVAHFAALEAKVGRRPGLDTPEELKAAGELRWATPWMVSSYLLVSDLRLFRIARDGMARLRPVPAAPPAPTLASSVANDLVAATAARHVPLLLIPELTRADLSGQSEGHPYYGIFAELGSGQTPGVRYQDLRQRLEPHELEPYFIDSVHLSRGGYALLARELDELLATDSPLAAFLDGGPAVPPP